VPDFARLGVSAPLRRDRRVVRRDVRNGMAPSSSEPTAPLRVSPETRHSRNRWIVDCSVGHASAWRGRWRGRPRFVTPFPLFLRHSREGGNPDSVEHGITRGRSLRGRWIPACAGM